ncbi:MAG: hypothetical protein ABII00_17830 [Elusimicrobiota bacterium]
MSEDRPPEPPKRPLPPRPGAPRPPAPPAAGLIHKEESALMEYMRQRMEIMEREIIKERERALASEGLLKQQESLRGEVESQLKKISEQLRQEKTVRDLEEEKQQSHGRVESLERRLDEMHKSWAGMLKDAMERQEAGRESLAPPIRAVSEDLAAFRQELRLLKEGLSRLREDVSPVSDVADGMAELRESVPAAVKRREAESQAVREELRGMADRLGESLLERLGAIDRRLAGELHAHQERLTAMTGDREALQEAIEERHHRVRHEYTKERIALETQFNDQIAELKASFGALAERQTGAADVLGQLQELAKKVHAILTRPAKAKDQMIQEIEAEKRDLMAALNQRTEQLRAYTLERREVERGMGESLMDLNRQLEVERAKRQKLKEHIGSLENTVEALKARIDLSKSEVQQKEDRFHSLAAERDSLVTALAEEAEKVRRQVEGRMESDKGWEGRIVEHQKLLNDERENRLRAEETVSELRARIQTLSEHMSRALREKDAVEKSSSGWDKEREELDATLRKKDEMISMLSATFQNLLKKPDA